MVNSYSRRPVVGAIPDVDPGVRDHVADTTRWICGDRFVAVQHKESALGIQRNSEGVIESRVCSSDHCYGRTGGITAGRKDRYAAAFAGDIGPIRHVNV